MAAEGYTDKAIMVLHSKMQSYFYIVKKKPLPIPYIPSVFSSQILDMDLCDLAGVCRPLACFFRGLSEPDCKVKKYINKTTIVCALIKLIPDLNN